MKYGPSYRCVVSLFALVGLAVGALAAQAVGVVPVSTKWLEVDSASRTAEFDLVAGLTSANAGMNFNGATAGAIRLTVPVGWHVVLRFRNADPNLPHSAEVIRAVTPLPPGVVPPVFLHAATGQLAQGLSAGGHKEMRFIADKAGSYFIYCAVQSHGMLGMWLRLDVSAATKRPTVTTAKQGAP